MVTNEDDLFGFIQDERYECLRFTAHPRLVYNHLHYVQTTPGTGRSGTMTRRQHYVVILQLYLLNIVKYNTKNKILVLKISCSSCRVLFN